MNTEVYMRRCLDLAREGAGKVAPNPMVGSVIVYKDTIIGEGYHQEYGGAHAEVNAINSVKDQDLLKDSVLFVNLEPCSHYGKTPPCTSLIIDKGIRHVVIGAVDSNELVAGRGIELMKTRGIKVEQVAMQEECYKLNKFYYCFHDKKRPYIILKWAQTSDGFIDRIRAATSTKGPNWITDKACRVLVHKWRSEVQTIMVGTNTILTDNPELTVRDWSGQSPMRIIPDRKGRLHESLKIYEPGAKTIIFTTVTKEDRDYIKYIPLSSENAPLSEILDHLFSMEIQSLFIEGGAELLRSFISSGTWDEARVFTGITEFGSGIAAPELPFTHDESLRFSDAKLEIFYNSGKY
jgi:diaminohydroxyphosphoribosylaminopyrimidine deaminase/5-amino-6-(5-phosphoribosylamino)uracil reductase